MRTLSFSLVVCLLLAFAACGGSDSGTDEGPAPTDLGPTTDVGADTGTLDEGPAPTDDGPAPTDLGPTPTDLGPKDDGPAPTDNGTPPDVPVTCPTVVTGPTCGEIAACALSCDDAAHQTACQAEGDTAAKDLFAALKTCAQTNDCTVLVEDEDLSACVREKCVAEIEACGKLTGKICRDIWKCRKDCDSEDVTCPLGCALISTVEQQAIWKTYRECIFEVDCTATEVTANGWPTDTCERYAQNNFCPIPAQACFPPQ